MAKVTTVFPDLNWAYFHIDYYYESSNRRLTLFLRGEDHRYYRLIFESVRSLRSIREVWNLLSYNLTADDFPEDGHTIYELHDSDVMLPLPVAIPGRHFFVFADNYNLDVYADAEPKLEEISEEEAFKSLSKEPFVSIRDMSFMDRYKPSQAKEPASDDEE